MMNDLRWRAELRKVFWDEIRSLRVNDGERVLLRERPTKYEGQVLNKSRAKELLAWGVQQLAELHDVLYAHNQHSLLICLQGMDAAGKDGTIRHIMSGLNPQGVKVVSFKSPSAEELDHDFLWRHYKALPSRGTIGIFNRSHYENVLISRVHPELVMREHLPGIVSVDDIDDAFWQKRYSAIHAFESIVYTGGTIILKFFLHLSKDEQRKRLLERIDDPTKNWKFSYADLRERDYWDSYQRAYEEVLSITSTKIAPWYIIPADDKWYARVAVAAIVFDHIRSLKLDYPTVSAEQKEALLEARLKLL